MNKIGQEQRLEQTTSLTASQIQAIKMLELTGIELDSRIERELEENPALEENLEVERQDVEGGDADGLDGRDWELGEYSSEDDIPAYKLQQIQERMNRREEIPFASGSPSLDELLMEQLSMTKLSERERELARYVIGNINADGYLDRATYQLQDELLFKVGIDASEDELESIIGRIKQLDPAGIGARDLRECLILQLERRDPMEAEVELALRLLRHHYEDFVNKRFDYLMEVLSVDADTLASLYTLISRLNPKPGNIYSDETEEKLSQYNPDFIVTESEGELLLSIVGERDIPPLRLCPTYVEMIEREKQAGGRSRKDREAMTFLKHKIEQAKWFIDAVVQRQNTLRTTMTAIMMHQREFFLSGEVLDLRPMILKDIASATGLDISTISRVSNSKSVQTDFGVYPLKFFFNEGIASEDGDEISTRRIKEALRLLIEGEDKGKPYSDAQLVDKLAEQGYNLARRTVAKYREQLRLPVARLRREL